MSTKPYLVLLYYHYTEIADPERFREEHHALCLELDLRGRIIVAAEGLNGTVSGLRANCEAYIQAIRSDSRFDGVDFKIEEVAGHTFQKLNVRLKPEIVHSGLQDIKPWKKTGKHLNGQDFQKLKEQEDVVILDVRSNYEHKVGKFKNAITLDMENFREFPDKISELEKYKDKKIITYCTGGIKCEKASAFLLENGFKDVFQLHGGIIKYSLETGGKDFDGKCYVFDNRIVADVNHINPTVISTCYICGEPSDRMINCASQTCNNHIPMCEPCGWKMEGCCSDDCIKDPDRRPYDGTGYYSKSPNGYHPALGFKRVLTEAEG